MAFSTPPLLAQDQPREPLTVMTFNIRYGTADDGENRWTARRDMVFEVIRRQDPDLLGLQEALNSQIDEIVAALQGYSVVGVGRDDGREAGEYSAILFRKARLRVAEAGTFWFSDTPSVPGSATWGNRYRVLYPDAGDAGTYTGFAFGKIDGEKIDYVLVPPGTEVMQADIIRWSRDRRYPSDHFPVVARVRLAR